MKLVLVPMYIGLVFASSQNDFRAYSPVLQKRTSEWTPICPNHPNWKRRLFQHCGAQKECYSHTPQRWHQCSREFASSPSTKTQKKLALPFQLCLRDVRRRMFLANLLANLWQVLHWRRPQKGLKCTNSTLPINHIFEILHLLGKHRNLWNGNDLVILHQTGLFLERL